MWTSAPLLARSDDHGGVDVADLLDRRLDQVGAHRLHLDDVAGEVAGHVEVVDGHVAEEAARDLEVLDRGRRRGRGW